MIGMIIPTSAKSFTCSACRKKNTTDISSHDIMIGFRNFIKNIDAVIRDQHKSLALKAYKNL